VFAFFVTTLLYALFRPTPPPELFAYSDKVGHLIIFFAVTLTGRLAGKALSDWVYWPAWAGLAVGLEYLQGALRPLRIFSLADAAANLTGTLVALAVWLILTKLFHRFHPEHLGTHQGRRNLRHPRIP
jgi:hypothetical protein